MHFSFTIVWVPREIERGTLPHSPPFMVWGCSHIRQSHIHSPRPAYDHSRNFLIPGQAEASLSLTLYL